MSLPPRARSVTPAPTIPPPASAAAPEAVKDEPSAVHRIAEGISPLKAIVAVLVVAFGAGGTAYAWAHSKADVVELHQVRDGAAAALGAAQANTSAQLGALAAQVQDLRAHQAGVDASLVGLTSDVARVQKTADGLFLQLVEIARTTGARQVREPNTKGPP